MLTSGDGQDTQREARPQGSRIKEESMRLTLFTVRLLALVAPTAAQDRGADKKADPEVSR
jgi:hypothetical protein